MKISDDAYERLNMLAGEVRAKTGEPVSINEAITELLEDSGGSSPLDFRGGWEMDDEEYRNIKEELKEMWSGWKIG